MILMSPIAAIDFARTLVSSTLFVSNLDLAFQSGYFDGAANQKPLLHTWSLSVEEQFYIFFPLLLLFLVNRLSFRSLAFMIFLFALISLFLGHLGSLYSPHKNYFFTYGRAWEMLTGSILALTATVYEFRRRWWSNILALLGLVGIGVSVFVYDKNTPFPSFYTLLPVLSTALIIMFARQDNLVGKILSLKYVVYIGLISYSLYLWHQPLIAYMNTYMLEAPDDLTKILVITLSVFLAWLSWKYIEQYARFRISTPNLLKACSAYAVFSIVIGFLVISNKGYWGNELDNPKWKVFSRDHYNLTGRNGNICHQGKPSDPCISGNIQKEPSYALIGDSFAGQYTEAYEEFLSTNKVAGYQFTYGGCLFLVEVESTRLGLGCAEKWKKTIKFVSEKSIDTIFLSGWWQGQDAGLYCRRVNETLCTPLRGSELISAYAESIESLAKLVNKVVVFYPQPTPTVDIRKYYNRGLENEIPTTKLSDFMNENDNIIAVFDQLSSSKILKMKPYQYLCNALEDKCNIVKNGKMLYMDNHLSNDGAKFIFTNISNST
jgi:peptidoglycan/LPS O-acetylase OafA/YrhL